MATYRFEAKIVSRSAGRSATAAAAYRAGECIKDERTGQSFDYSRMGGVLHSEILTPAGTPDWMKDRSQLWNAVEAAEKRKDAQLARDLVLSLPHELTHEQRANLVQEFVAAEFVAEGMIVDFSIHAPDRKGDPRNHHAHVMLTMRELTGDGFGNKERAWNDRDVLEQWREDWAIAINRELERHGHEARVDHRSLAEQGIDREPEPKQGPIATEMEREGQSSHAGADRNAARARNQARSKLAAEIKKLQADIIDLEQERQKRAGQAMNDNLTDKEVAQLALEKEEQQRIQAQLVEANHKAEEIRLAEIRREEERRTEQQNKEARAVEQAKENADRLSQQVQEMQALHERFEAFREKQAKMAEEARRQEEQQRHAREQADARAEAIHNAGSRYGQALAQHYDVGDPYGSLARASMAEYGSFLRDREALAQEIARADDPAARRSLELRREIEYADYIAITSERIARQSEIIAGRSNTNEAIRQYDRADTFQREAKELREQFREHEMQRAHQSEAEPEKAPEADASRSDETQSRKENVPGKSADPTSDLEMRWERNQRSERVQQHDSERPKTPEADVSRSDETQSRKEDVSEKSADPTTDAEVRRERNRQLMQERLEKAAAARIRERDPGLER